MIWVRNGSHILFVHQRFDEHDAVRKEMMLQDRLVARTPDLARDRGFLFFLANFAVGKGFGLFRADCSWRSAGAGRLRNAGIRARGCAAYGDGSWALSDDKSVAVGNLCNGSHKHIEAFVAD
jgi:hypothetical protein